MTSVMDKYLHAAESTDPMKCYGKVQRVKGQLIEALGPQSVIGEVCLIEIPRKNEWIGAEVVGLDGNKVQLMPYDDVDGIEVGSRIKATGELLSIPVGSQLLGRVLDCRCRPLDGGPPIRSADRRSVFQSPPNPMDRTPINKKINTGIRSIDTLVAMGKGQRMGIFAGSGVGKSTLLGMVARYTSADVNVVSLIGERGREVREFLENELGPEGLKRSVVFVSTSDTTSISRVRGAYSALAAAEFFRDQGKDVMLLFDSVTRLANAQREIGLSIGEPPATRGYTPSVFSLLPKLLERCGVAKTGTITGLFTILVEGDDLDEPVSDTVRGILDGHIVLNRKLAEQNHYPAVDVLRSISRLANRVLPPQVREAAAIIRRYLAIYSEAEDLINAGAYVKGSNPEIDKALTLLPQIRAFLQQKIEERADPLESMRQIAKIAGISLPMEVS